MIQSFRDAGTKDLFESRSCRRWAAIASVALRKLDQLEASTSLTELHVPPGNRPEALKGGKKGQHSIRINEKYRVRFVWKPDGAHEVETTDYHWSAQRSSTHMTIARPTTGWKMRRVTTHPGEMLREEFLTPLGMSQNALAMKIRVPATRIGDILHGRRGITPDTALRLSRFFGNSPEFWLNLQQMHDLSKARMELGEAIEREVEEYPAA